MKSDSETYKCHARRETEGFFKQYIHGKGIDVGCGIEPPYLYNEALCKISPSALGHDINMCDGHTMEIFEDECFDYVYASHILEHLDNPILALENWYRICKVDGFIIIAVPSLWRYEKRVRIPRSKWNPDHKRGYTPAALLREIEEALIPNSYVVEYCKDCCDQFDWSMGPEEHSKGEYQIECVLKKIHVPEWTLISNSYKSYPKQGPFKFYFYDHRTSDLAQVCVDRDDCTAIVSLETLKLLRNIGFSAQGLREMMNLVIKNQQVLLKAWHEKFGHKN